MAPASRKVLAGLALAALTTSASADERPTQTLTLSEAIALGLRQNPRLAAARHQSNASSDGAASQRGRLLPLVKLGLAYDHLKANEGLNLGSLSGGGSSSGNKPTYIDFWGGDFSVTVAQPLLGLGHLSEDLTAAEKTAAAAAREVQTAEADLRTGIEIGYLALFEAQAERGIAAASVQQLNEQYAVAQARFRDGALTQADVLRFEVAAANAAQQGLQAQVQEENARDQLLGLLGLAGHVGREAVEFADPTEEFARRPVPSDELSAYALAHRPELQAATLQRDAAWSRKQARYLNLLPELNVAYSYYRLIGVPAALPSDINLLGFSASWNFWDWGATYYQAHAAGEELEAASANRDSVGQQIEVEVQTRASQERAAANAVKVANEVISQAEEAFRVTLATVKAGAATTTDLLDAQAALTQARLNQVRSKYEELRARASLLRALAAEPG